MRNQAVAGGGREGAKEAAKAKVKVKVRVGGGSQGRDGRRRVGRRADGFPGSSASRTSLIPSGTADHGDMSRARRAQVGAGRGSSSSRSGSTLTYHARYASTYPGLNPRKRRTHRRSAAASRVARATSSASLIETASGPEETRGGRADRNRSPVRRHAMARGLNRPTRAVTFPPARTRRWRAGERSLDEGAPGPPLRWHATSCLGEPRRSRPIPMRIQCRRGSPNSPAGRAFGWCRAYLPGPSRANRSSRPGSVPASSDRRRTAPTATASRRT